ncbi:hypothetical protein [Pseudomonas sp. LP_7_YM]|uniref:hypothetical protein n=1 Tax=Pseudomonas sp. LP_7_YM TaxID=2485137 RepID=UPI00105D41FE|nr:hypothetical protein [Pseudomonas sp. LP_7_YM]TDV64486.1 hypothetical protein EC915_105190 [Pseudomonas sp. LP_7_YM]
MGNSDEKNIKVDRGIPPANPYGSGNGLNPSRDGWSIGWGGGGGSEGGRPGTLSSSKRRRLRLQDKRRREWEARQRAEVERLEAQAAAKAQADAQANAIAHAEARARAQAAAEAQQVAHAAEQARVAAAQARATADRKQAVAAHRQALEILPHAQTMRKQELDQKHANDLAGLSTSLALETQREPALADLRGAELLDAILAEKARVNYWIAQKSEASESSYQRALLFAGTDPLEITNEQYKAILGAKSGNAEQAHQVHQAWAHAYADALDAKLYSNAVTQLRDRSASLSEYYATASWATKKSANDNEALSPNQLLEANRFWSVVAGPTAPSRETPTAADKSKAVAEKFFTRQVSRLLSRALPHLTLL